MKHPVLVVLAVAVSASPALAQTSNKAPGGPLYTLNIIGVETDRTIPTTESNRHTIFVAIGRTDADRIYLTPSLKFEVCDGNAFDAAFDCNGIQIAPEGAVLGVPCNTSIRSEPTEPGPPFPCDVADSVLAYRVSARSVGGPGGSSVTTTCATDAQTAEVICSRENILLVRNKGQSTFTDVTQELTSLVVCVPDTEPVDSICDRLALFRDEFEDWFWQYANSGLRLAQIRFYPI